MTCTSCSRPVPDGSRFCPHCAAPAPAFDATRTSAPHGVSSSDPSDHGRFIPGTMLGGRYRVVGLLGRGGMGEVYRADDLKLGQAVALKFLPAIVENDPARLQRFLNEVKIARQISHPNVCRVYDVGEVDGHHYLSMEYVDGEDLASLLRRIGRLPKDKAVEISRQLCVGLAAAHEQGILHRDLKPANVMIDGRGRAKITDFGLATLAGTVRADEVGAGTPLYMAPEQRAGKDVTVRSDLYSLGLVLYELFTGQQAFKASTHAELARLQAESTPTSPKRLVEDLDPMVERAILRCLAKEPRDRPASALVLAASLPGGDPLAAALAAGETPSPEMVADAGEAGGLRPWIAAACVAAIVLGAVVGAAKPGRNELVMIAPPQKPAVELAVEARQIAEETGYGDDPADSAYQFFADTDHLKEIKERDPSPARWDRLRAARPAPILFWYRQSPRPLASLESVGDVSEQYPPLSVSGMVSMRLDSAGRLVRLMAVPPQFDESEGPGPTADWSALFRRAGLVETSFAPVRPAWNPLVDCDERRAWTGAYPDQPDMPIRVETGSYKGKPVYFDVVASWNKPWRQEIEPWEAGQKAVAVLGTVLLVVVVGGAALLARRNLRLGRADRRGAFRLAAFLFLLHLVRAGLWAHYVMEFEEIGPIFVTTAGVLLVSALAWLIYIALEPYVRRLWPDVLISWSRLLDGRLRDPRIGRDILVGGAAFAGFQVLGSVRDIASRWMGVPPGMPSSVALFFLSGARMAAASFLEFSAGALSGTILILFLVLLLRVILRSQWAAVGGSLLMFIFASTVQSDMPALAWVFAALIGGTILFVLIRFGLLACVVCFLFGNFSQILWPISHFPAWYARPSVAALLAMTTLIVYGLVISLAGRPIFRESILPS